MRVLPHTTLPLAAMLAVVACAVAAQAAAPVEQTIATVVTGTAHQALFDIALDGEAGIAVGAGGQVLTTRDGGKSWMAVKPAPTAHGLFGVAISGARKIVVGQAGLVLIRDGDGAWRKASSGTEERLFAVALNGEGVAVAVGAFGKVLRSADGGATWASIAPDWSQGYAEQGLEPHLYDVHVAADGTCTLVGEFGLVLRSTDAGATWTVLHQGTASLFALDLRDDGLGYAVGQGGVILRTTDGGGTWSEVPSGTQANLLGVRSSATGEVLVTAMRDMLASDDGLAWRRVEWGDFASAWYSSVAVTDTGAASRALVVGHSGRIVQIGL
jgi:Photosynthesis system II assembly factor YCF48